MEFAMMERKIIESRISLMIKYLDRLKCFESIKLIDYQENE
ncbi:hypothetical protein [Microcystis aeruginosa]|nr:hypothetical protein [Microcystis aeruginosa]